MASPNGSKSNTEGNSTANPAANPGNTSSTQGLQRDTAQQAGQQQSQPAGGSKKRKNHRSGRKKRNRRQSFAPSSENGEGVPIQSTRPDDNLRDIQESEAAQPSFYGRGNLSSTSLDSEALLDHRDHPPMRPRRQSTMQGSFGPRPSQSATRDQRPRYSRAHASSEGDSEDGEATDRTPLISTSNRDRPESGHGSGYGGFFTHRPEGRRGSHQQPRRSSVASSRSNRHGRHIPSRNQSSGPHTDYNVNNPPSVPSSPKLNPELGLDDVMIGEYAASRSPNTKRGAGPLSRDAVVDVDNHDNTSPNDASSSPPTPRRDPMDHRRRTIALPAEEDVCFPLGQMSEMADDDYHQPQDGHHGAQQRRRRNRLWPDLSVLEDWSREEKEERSEVIRAKKISEPVLVGGRLRPQKSAWHRTEEDAPYRFTYFNEEFQSTIHSQSLSELVQPGQSFKDLFIPDPPELSDDSSDEEDDTVSHQGTLHGQQTPWNGHSKADTRSSSIIGEQKSDPRNSSGEATPSQPQPHKSKPKRLGARPTFWLDVLSPTEAEMRVLSKTFGIHPLTAEDIMMQEAREKVELFRNYYLVSYRTFEQDKDSEDFLEPVDMYVVVFREGVISFHFSMTPHPANVRRRIRQLKDYLILSSDWISYAIIDDITDAFAPLIHLCEVEVDDIDDMILQMHSSSDEEKQNSAKHTEYKSEKDVPTANDKGSDMLRRVGDARKKVMLLYRLLGNKADVIKGFAKRCNEQWDVAPRSEIGLYLGDIQDHIVTMTGNLTHYENILSRSHSNYLAQISIRMNERQEQTADVLGKLTVLGTIVLPMNIVTGMWGMNVLVPGQNVDNLTWFWCSTSPWLFPPLLTSIMPLSNDYPSE
ncbi:MAG: CorA metal ion transporter [Candelina mexicana]|nr:MAG: CorA metal ion transporter [Candelina mexicana]